MRACMHRPRSEIMQPFRRSITQRQLRRSVLRPTASRSGDASPAEEPSNQSESPKAGSEAWRKRPASIAMPAALRSPGAWFCLAGRDPSGAI
eukprot:scaffold56578_cov53-Prasinocladus_malaysianus.AAC.1